MSRTEFVCFNHPNHKDEVNGKGENCSCPGVGGNFHVFSSRTQGGKDLTDVKCSKAGGSLGCGQKGHVKLWDTSSENKAPAKAAPKVTGSDFESRLKASLGQKEKSDFSSPLPGVPVIGEDKETGLVIPLQLINILHMTILDRIKSFFGWEDMEFDRRTIQVLDNALADIIRNRTGEVESTPEMVYLSTWGMVILTGIMKGGIRRKEKEEPQDEDNKPDTQ